MALKRRRLRLGTVAIVCAVMGTAIYLLMINVTLARIEALSGLRPFDMRPFGYGSMEAIKLLDALGAEGRWYYLTRQIPLDTAYPALLAMTLICAIYWLGLRLPYSKLTRAGILFSAGTAFFDYVENLGVIGMLRAWPDLPELLVNASSSASILKSSLTVAAVSTTLILAVLWLQRSREA